MIAGGRVIIDEAGIEYNNREFKDFSKKSLYFYKYHRHYQLAVDVFSQGFDDMDKKIRTLAPWSTKIIFSPPLWKMFNTISREEYPQKEWKKW